MQFQVTGIAFYLSLAPNSEKLDAKEIDLQLGDRDALARLFGEIAIEAGSAIMRVRAGTSDVSIKKDGSPVTAADLAANEIICRRLLAALPYTPIVSEETPTLYCQAEGLSQFILVDPLDGTREFIAGRDEFTVNIGLIDQGMPAAGVVYAPALNQLYLAGTQAFSTTVQIGSSLPSPTEMRPLKARVIPPKGWKAVASRSHLDADTTKWIEENPVTELHSAGSSLKFCSIATADADVYPRLAPTMEWDTAAGHAILNAAGGSVLGLDGLSMGYGKPEFRNGSFVAWARSAQ